MNSLKSVWNELKIRMFNIKYKTNLKSKYCSLKAKYGYGVSVEKGTYVGEDVSISDYSYINQKSYIENCSIGKYCSISSGVYICPYEHPLDQNSTHPMLIKPIEKREKVIIGHDVLISLNSIILSGVKIGNGAVIGAGAVVTHDVMPYEIVGGVPAKHIGFRDARENTSLEARAWWDFSPEYLRKEWYESSK